MAEPRSPGPVREAQGAHHQARPQRPYRHLTWSSATSAQTSRNELFVGDITYIPTDEGFCFLASVFDICSRRLVGWSSRPTCAPACAPTPCWPPPGYAAGRPSPAPSSTRTTVASTLLRITREVCERLGITQSMGSVGDSYDNAMAESFFSSLKRELVDASRFRTIAEARPGGLRMGRVV